MTTNSDDISFVLSGGTGNIVPNLSLGGNPSSTPILDNTLNNLFDDVSTDESESGIEDYRCIYIFNDGDSIIYDPQIFIISDFVDGASIMIGVVQKNEIQRITITGDTVTGGSMTLSYEGQTFTSNYNADLGTWSTSLQNQLNSLLDEDDFNLLEDVVVTAQSTGSNTILFDINYNGRDGSRNHELLTVISNDLTPSVSIGITTLQTGGPINSFSDSIGVETTPPGGVIFSGYTSSSPLTFPYLKPEEGFPLWIKREILSDTEAIEQDGVILRFVSNSLRQS